MRYLVLAVAGLLAVSLFTTFRLRSAEGYWPTRSWRTSTPEAQGFDSEALASALKAIQERRIPIHSLLIERNGYLILDTYFFPFKRGEKHDLASATKSITSTLIGIAIGEGKITGVREQVLSLFSDRANRYSEARKQRMTIEDLLTMRSGLDCHFDHGELTLNQMRASPHWIPFMLDLPMKSDPGSEWVYCSGGMHVLSGIVSKVTGRNELAYAQEMLFAPLGIRDVSWPADPDGVSDGWGDLHFQPSDMAKIGYLWLQSGVWDGRQVVPTDYLRAATQPHNLVPEYGYGFWVYQNRRPAIFDNLGPVFEAQGRGGQRIWVFAEKNMVVVTTGGGFEPADVGALIFPALKSDDPLSPNPAGDVLLASASRIGTQPPPLRPAQQLPPVARAISGKTYLLNHNGLGLKSLFLKFSGTSPTLSLESENGLAETRPVGFDGQPRISRSHNTRPPATSTFSIDGYGDTEIAASGVWEDDHTLIIDYNTVGNINDYQIHLVFRGRRVEVTIGEGTGIVNQTIEGHLR
jgi:CubicO group peptidase (beta-lactamase class C family)